MARDRAFRAYCARGGYPQAQERQEVAWPEIAQFLNETVVQRTIQHDLRLGARGQRRDPQLLEEVFRLACRYAGQAPGSATFIAEIQQTLAANVGWQRVSQYLDFLAGALLVHRIEPLEIKLKRRKGAAKICLSDLSLRQAWLGEVVSLYPDDLARTPHLADLAGHLAESAAGQFLSTMSELQLRHFPARPTEPEVDFVMTIGAYRVPVEVKYRRRVQAHEDTVGLRAFLERTAYNAPFGLLVTQADGVHVDDPRIVPVSLASLLWLR